MIQQNGSLSKTQRKSLKVQFENKNFGKTGLSGKKAVRTKQDIQENPLQLK